jgi:oligopeptide/dipeptide ABC transporter ATP-binding protein
MAQRVAIALAIARDPKLVIADEPTAALDSSVRQQILTLLFGLRSQIGASILFLSHDIGSVGRFCDRVAVMYGGRIVEDGPASRVLRDPVHPYTAALLASAPGTERPNTRLEPIPGVPPIIRGRSEACAFTPRCRFAAEVCARMRPEPRTVGAQTVVCHRADEISLTAPAGTS